MNTRERIETYQKFARRGTFLCGNCGKRTREVNENIGLYLCELCAVKSGCGNTLSDSGQAGDSDPWGIFENCTTEEECHELLQSRLNIPKVEGGTP